MTTPSRDFLVRQATLNAMALRYAHSLEYLGRAYVGRRLSRLLNEDFTEGRIFARCVCREFDRIVAPYVGVAA